MTEWKYVVFYSGTVEADTEDGAITQALLDVESLFPDVEVEAIDNAGN